MSESISNCQYLSIIKIIITHKMFDEQQAEIESKVWEVKSQHSIPEQQKNTTIKALRQSIATETYSSTKVITSVANTMVGSAMIVYPVLFVKDGMVGSTLIMLTVGCVQYLTCRLLVLHNRASEMNYSDTIKRICGQKIYKLNLIVNCILLFFVSSAYFLLIAQNFYQVSSAIIDLFMDFNPPKSSQIHFGTYSFQYATIIAMVLLVPLLLSKTIDTLLKFFKYTVYCVFAYGIFVLASFIRQAAEGNISFDNYKLFDPNFSSVAGAFALSFLLHPVAAPTLKKNVKQENNERDLLLGYGLTAFIYFFVGFVGGLSCATSASDIILNPKNYSTIFDCVNQKDTKEELTFFILGKIVQFGILVQNASVLPILNFLSRKEFVQAINKPKYQKILFYGYSISLIIFSAGIGILCINVDIILSFDGAIVGFFISYGIPIVMHLTCLYKKMSKEEKILRASLLESGDQLAVLQAEKEFGMQIQFSRINEEEVQNIVRCNPHKKTNKITDFALYGCLLLIGIALGIFKLLAFFQ